MSHACGDAIRVAATAGEALRPDQAEVAHLFQVLEGARTADPRLSEIREDEGVSLTRVLAAPTNPAISAAWDAGTLLTGVSMVDQVLVEAGVVDVVKDSIGSSYTLVLGYPSNTSEIEAALNAAGGMIASVDGEDIVDSDIAVGLTADGYLVTFMMGWGDCHSGCINRHYWDVSVDASGDNSELLRERGDPLP